MTGKFASAVFFFISGVLSRSNCGPARLYQTNKADPGDKPGNLQGPPQFGFWQPNVLRLSLRRLHLVYSFFCLHFNTSKYIADHRVFLAERCSLAD